MYAIHTLETATAITLAICCAFLIVLFWASVELIVIGLMDEWKANK